MAIPILPTATDLLSNQRMEYHNGLRNGQPNGVQQESRPDGHDDDPIAVCGLAIKFPEDATTPEKLWKMLLDKRCVSRDFPQERFNAEGFYSKDSKINTVRDTLPTAISESHGNHIRHLKHYMN